MIIRELLTYLGIKADSTKLEAFNSRVDAVKSNLLLAAGAATAFGAALFGAAKLTADAGDKIAKDSAKLGLTTDAYQELSHAATLAGTSIDGVSFGMKGLAAKMELVKTGSKTAVDTFRKLGISASSLTDTDTALEAIADRIAAMPNGMQKTALAMELFGRSGMQMIPMLNAGGKGIRAMRKEAHELGVVMSEQTTKDSEAFNDSLFRVKQGGTALMYLIGAEMLPQFTEVSDRVVKWIKANRDLIKTRVRAWVERIIVVGRKVYQVLSDIWKRVDALVESMGGWEVTLKRIGTALLVAFAVSTIANVLKMGSALLAASKALLALKIQAVAAQLSMFLWAAAILAIALAVHDLWVYAQGGDSAIGRFFEHFKGQEGIIGGIVRKIIKLQDGLSALMDVNLGEQRVRIIPDDEGTTWLWEIQQMPGRIKDAFVEFGEWLGESAAKMWLGFRDSAIDAFDAISAAIRSALGSALTWASDRVGDLASALGSLRGALGIGSAAPSPSPGISLPSIPIPGPSGGSSVSQSSTVDVGGISVQVAGSNASPESIGEAVADAIGGVVRRARLGFAGGDA